MIVFELSLSCNEFSKLVIYNEKALSAHLVVVKKVDTCE